VLHEVAGRDDLDLARPDIGLVDDAAHAAPVVAMRMRIDHGHDRELAEMFVDQLQRCPGGLLGGQGVEDDPAGFALDERDVGQVEAAKPRTW